MPIVQQYSTWIANNRTTVAFETQLFPGMDRATGVLRLENNGVSFEYFMDRMLFLAFWTETALAIFAIINGSNFVAHAAHCILL
jgi:hypothetical protein